MSICLHRCSIAWEWVTGGRRNWSACFFILLRFEGLAYRSAKTSTIVTITMPSSRGSSVWLIVSIVLTVFLFSLMGLKNTLLFLQAISLTELSSALPEPRG